MAQRKMTLAKELAVLRRLHAAEVAVNPPKVRKDEHLEHADHEQEKAKKEEKGKKEEKVKKEEKGKVEKAPAAEGKAKAPKEEKVAVKEKEGKEKEKEKEKEEKGKGKGKEAEAKGKEDKEAQKDKKDKETKPASTSKKGSAPPASAPQEQQQQQTKESKKKDKEADEKRQFKEGLEDLLIRKFFYVPAFEIYGGVAGLYDFGPTGCAIKANVLDFWRQHFVLTENMLEVSCASLTPEVVLKTSGHVDKFTDFMVRDVVTHDCYRADKLIEEYIDKYLEKHNVNQGERAELLRIRTEAGAMNAENLDAVIAQRKIKAPDTGNDLSGAFAFNLMFSTQIGPTGKLLGYMRPETAQGIFVNFKRLLDYNGGRMPFAAAQIGLAFRNEIAPRAGLLRVREFPLAEIEHFVDPKNKRHPKFPEVANMQLQLLSREDQTGEDVAKLVSLGDAVAKGIINNETLAYYMARTQLFFNAIGANPQKVRFRQHKKTEMAHYAQDCWDAECYLQGYGWVECVGHADRAAYDLEMHTQESKVVLNAEESLPEPIVEELTVVKPNKGVLGKLYRDASKILLARLETMTSEDARALRKELSEQGRAVVRVCEGEEFELKPDMVSIVDETRKTSVRKYIPSVIEPSFGIGRIIYAILDHSYVVRRKKGEVQKLLQLSPIIAPVKAAILTTDNNPDYLPIVHQINESLVLQNISSRIDTSSSASIGKKYARSDEIGVPFSITVDPSTPTDQQVTIRDRDSTTQIRLPISALADVLSELTSRVDAWPSVSKRFPKFESPADLE